ncbi:MAG: hypothetical protein CMK23_08885 [Porticoccaceae bacterium]|nr:hypothetical protein [Porticoccaceae bacterium]
MLSFMEYISEAADSAQNLHMTHADEDIFERGDTGAQAAIDFLKDFAETVGTNEANLTVKWDGAPALFAGYDPSDNKFFVGTKSVFAKNPKLYKTQKDITDNEKGGKAQKLKVALKELPSVGIPKGTVLQGDMLFTKGDQKYETIDGVRYLTVHPNTIVYAWPSNSDVAKRIRNANIGIIWHTSYSGRGDLSTYSATFGVDVSKLKTTRNVFMDDAYFKGANIGLDDNEHRSLMSHISKAERYIGNFDDIVTVMNTIPSSAAGANVKTFINSKIRAGQLPNPRSAANEYLDYLKTYWEDKVISKVKSETAINTKKAALKQLLDDLKNIMPTLVKAFQYVDEITQAKMIAINKLNMINNQKTFVLTNDGFKVTEPEGYVAINTEKGEAVKFVDRLNFSHFNFSSEYIKGWQR